MHHHEGQPLVVRGRSLEESHAVAIMMHGRGRTTDDILELANRIGNSAFTYLAPTAKDNTWYPYGFMEAIEKNEPFLSSALAIYDALIGQLLEKGFSKQQIILLGFSQGACLTAEYAVRHADRYGGIVLFTGGLIGPPGTSWHYPGSFQGTPIFLGTSDIDGFVPRERVQESAAIFEQMRAQVIERVYPGMDHIVNDDEIAIAQAIMQAVSA
ncbi:MAG TPA: phospholipase [Ktedonobacter sp.]|jgi:predicted esterase|nr:phospholipase [Ktedonobacter sp.]HBE28776.1 phospholipase [Ktedonobacter sp.]HCF87141.1 phospholipase [Ktedonobacter sp.]HCJ34010.1 phospholipase [Ktedonobacter sp.]